MTVTDAPTAELASRLAARVDTSAGPGACHPWTGHTNDDGYGLIKIGGRRASPTRVHRLAYQLAHLGEPMPLVVRHSCDNPPCCNPEHLLAGTQGDNNDDRDQRDRVRHGDRHPAAKLKATDVAAIVSAYDRGESQRSIGRRYGVSQQTISDVTRAHTWRRTQEGAE